MPDHPIMQGMPREFRHANDELYQNSVIRPDCQVLATAYADKSIDPKNSAPDNVFLRSAIHATDATFTG